MTVLDYLRTVEATGRRLQGRLVFQGLPVSVENRVGSVRKGVDVDDKPWKTKLANKYGYIRGTVGVDGDQVDCFIGPNEDAANVYVIHIKKADSGKYDEDKCFLGFDSAAAARKAFDANYTTPEKFFHGIDEMSVEAFKKKVLATKDRPMKLVASASHILGAMQIYATVPESDTPRVSVGDQVTVAGLRGRGVVMGRKGRRIKVQFRNGDVVDRDQRDIIMLGGRLWA